MSVHKKYFKIYGFLRTAKVKTLVVLLVVLLVNVIWKYSNESVESPINIQREKQESSSNVHADDNFEQKEKEEIAYIEEQEIDAELKKAESVEDNQGWVVENPKDFYPLLFIYDGDTIAISVEGEMEKIRLIGIDTPETSEKYRSVECYGEEATNRATELLKDKKVRVEADETQDDEDVYGRSLRYVFLEDGTFFNQLMIEEGFAEEYTFKGREYKYQKEFRSAEERAQEEERGLWGDCGAIKN